MLLLPSFAAQRMKHPVPILLYHAVSEAGVPGSTPVAVFRGHMEFLEDAGYETLGLSRFEAIVEGREESSPRHVLITFDGCFRSLYSAVWPVLREHGFSATMFVPAGTVQRDDSPSRRRERLNWRELQEMRSGGGIDIQCRGYSEGSFRPGVRFGGRWRCDRVRSDLAIAREALAKNLDIPAESLHHLAWPGGYRDTELDQLAAELGFRHRYVVWRGAVTRHGATDRLPRLRCDGLSERGFARQLRWLSHSGGAEMANFAGTLRSWSESTLAYCR
jgi:peptidoglycan/xylan/chitin deacetylase (PgdA/CDA1 family)